MNSASQNFPHHLGVLRERMLHPTDYETAVYYFLEEFVGKVMWRDFISPEDLPTRGKTRRKLTVKPDTRWFPAKTTEAHGAGVQSFYWPAFAAWNNRLSVCITLVHRILFHGCHVLWEDWDVTANPVAAQRRSPMAKASTATDKGCPRAKPRPVNRTRHRRLRSIGCARSRVLACP
jgi:hypothetical protein